MLLFFVAVHDAQGSFRGDPADLALVPDDHVLTQLGLFNILIPHRPL